MGKAPRMTTTTPQFGPRVVWSGDLDEGAIRATFAATHLGQLLAFKARAAGQGIVDERKPPRTFHPGASQGCDANLDLLVYVLRRLHAEPRLDLLQHLFFASLICCLNAGL